MVQFAVNTHRLDPYKNFKFRVKWDNIYVAGLSKMSAIKRTTETIEWREAGGPSVIRKMPGRTKFEPITFEVGLTHDPQLMSWADQVNTPRGDAAMSLKNYRKEVTVEVLNMQAVPVIEFTLHRAWVSEFQALPEMDANANAVAISTLKIEYEGFSVSDALRELIET
ncbi:phage tail protein [Kribbella sancticallisti]|uniref:Phage tail protein n=1 Tax=Kribbella sancticallisti TaxID=460087 RepID=A0ABP4MZ59_9ACTN